MSWIIDEQAKTGNVQYLLANYEIPGGLMSGNSTKPLNISGYTRGTIIAVGGTSLEIYGSNDGTNFFLLQTAGPVPPAFGPTANPILWNYALRNIQFKSNGGTFSSIYLIGIAGGGNAIHDVTHQITGTPAVQPTSLQYCVTPNVTWGGCNNNAGSAQGAWYDKTANTNNGQIQLGAGTNSTPMLSFSDGTDYDSGVYLAQANISSTILGFSTGGNILGGCSSGDGTVPFAGVKAGFNINSGLALRRISGTQGNTSWEDGYFGNSEKMIFTPSDFDVSGAMRVRPPPPQPPTGMPLTNNSSVCQVLNSWPELVFENVNNTQVIAMRLIPKGYFIPSVSAGSGWLVKSTSGGDLGGSIAAFFQAFTWNPTWGTSNSLGAAVRMNAWVSGNNTQYASTATGINTEGTGDTFIVLVITTPASMTCSNGLAGVFVPIKRML